MIIRKAAESDISAISELAEKIWWPSYRNIISDEQISFMLNDMYSAESLKEQMGSGIEFLIVEKENLPVAFAGYSLTNTENQVYKLHKLYVLPTEQGRGTGRKLIEQVSSLATAKGGKILELNVNRGNPAHHFYSKIGFDIYHYVMRKKL